MSRIIKNVKFHGIVTNIRYGARVELDRRRDTPTTADDIIHEAPELQNDVPAPDERDTPLAADEATTPLINTIEAEPVSTLPPTSPKKAPTYVHPTRIRRPPEKLNLYGVYPMTAKRALKENPGEISMRTSTVSFASTPNATTALRLSS